MDPLIARHAHARGKRLGFCLHQEVHCGRSSLPDGSNLNVGEYMSF
jgi:hypothetical protein